MDTVGVESIECSYKCLVGDTKQPVDKDSVWAWHFWLVQIGQINECMVQLGSKNCQFISQAWLKNKKMEEWTFFRVSKNSPCFPFLAKCYFIYKISLTRHRSQSWWTCLDVMCVITLQEFNDIYVVALPATPWPSQPSGLKSRDFGGHFTMMKNFAGHFANFSNVWRHFETFCSLNIYIGTFMADLFGYSYQTHQIKYTLQFLNWLKLQNRIILFVMNQLQYHIEIFCHIYGTYVNHVSWQILGSMDKSHTDLNQEPWLSCMAETKNSNWGWNFNG